MNMCVCDMPYISELKNDKTIECNIMTQNWGEGVDIYTVYIYIFGQKENYLRRAIPDQEIDVKIAVIIE